MQFDRDMSTVAPAQAPQPLETGWYPANIITTEEKPNTKATGTYLEVKHRISSGPFTGRVMTSRHNIKHTNPQTVDIAYAEVAAICHAVGRPAARSAIELHGGLLEIYVKKEPRTDKPTEMGNNVAGFRAIGAGGPVGFTGATGTQATAAPAWAQPAPPVQAGYAPPPQPVYAPPVAAAPAQPAWAPPPQPAAAQPPQYAPPPAAPAAPAAPAGAVPPWAR